MSPRRGGKKAMKRRKRGAEKEGEEEENQTKAISERLFDQLFPQKPLQRVENNYLSRKNVGPGPGPGPEARVRRAHKEGGRAVRFLEEKPNGQQLPLENETRKKGKKKEGKNYPNCTRDKLLEAFEQANLPDFEAIAKHELHISSARAEQIHLPDPPLSELVKPWEDDIDWDKLDMTKVNPLEGLSRKKYLLRRKGGSDVSASVSSWETPSGDREDEASNAPSDESQLLLETTCIRVPLNSSQRQTSCLSPVTRAGRPVRRSRAKATLGQTESSDSAIPRIPGDLDSDEKSTFVAPKQLAPRREARTRTKVSQSICAPRLDLVNGADETLEAAALLSCRVASTPITVSKGHSVTLARDISAIASFDSPDILTSRCESRTSTFIGSTADSVRPLKSWKVNNRNNSSVFPPIGLSALSASTSVSSDHRTGSQVSSLNSLPSGEREQRVKRLFDLRRDCSQIEASFLGNASLANVTYNEPTPKPSASCFRSATSCRTQLASNISRLASHKRQNKEKGSLCNYRGSICSTLSRLSKSGFISRTVVNRQALSESNLSTGSSLSLVEGLQNKDLKHMVASSFVSAFTVCTKVYNNGEEEQLTPREKVLALCSPPSVGAFEEVLSTEIISRCHKIGEGSYGEVFKSFTDEGVEVVLKIVALNMTQDLDLVFSAILPELVVCYSFNELRENEENQAPNFIHMMKSCCIKGSYPKKMIEEWDAFNRRKGSENDDPRTYGLDQIHLVMVLNNGGCDLETYKFASALHALSIFQQVAFSLAAAESAFEFEHRDLHWGNILVKDEEGKREGRSIAYRVHGKEYVVDSQGVFASIIDFSLSRISKDGITVFDDLSKYTDIFEGSGDDDYQFEVYRLMRDANGNDWEGFLPKTNVLWLHYLLDKLLRSKKYRSRAKAHEAAMNRMRDLETIILSFDSAANFVANHFSSTS